MIGAASLGIVILAAFGQAYRLSKGEQNELIESKRPANRIYQN